MTISDVVVQSSTSAALPQLTNTNSSTTSNAGSFTQVMESATQKLSSSDLLLTQPVRAADKPGMKDFMDATGTDASMAAELLYGVMGSNSDYRNWKTIMSAADPLQAAKQATAAQYSSALPYADNTNAVVRQGAVLAKTENLVAADNGKSEPNAVYLTDKQGMLLRWVQPEATSIATSLDTFGFATSQVNDLTAQLKSSTTAVLPLLQSSSASITTTASTVKSAAGADIGVLLQATSAEAAVSTTTAQQSVSSGNLLLTQPIPAADKPGMKDFMDATGTDASMAAELLYGVIGSNSDYRNWKTIMSAADPLQAAKQATAAQYNSDLPYSTVANKPLASANSVVAKTSNLEIIDYGELAPPAVYLTDKQGMLLRWLRPDSESITTGLDNFGFDTSQVNDLITQLKALNNVKIEQQLALV